MKELTGGSELVTEAFSALNTVGEEMEELLDGDIGKIIDQVSEVTDLVDEVKPVLDMAKSLLG
jgi:archaellum component FlaC